jgi:hypothetical protein
MFVSGVLIYLSQALSLHVLRGFWIARGIFDSWILYWFYVVGCILFIVLMDITHAAYLQLQACKEPPWDGVEA